MNRVSRTNFFTNKYENRPNSFIEEFHKFLRKDSVIFVLHNTSDKTIDISHCKDNTYDGIIDLTVDSESESEKNHNEFNFNTQEIANNIIDFKYTEENLVKNDRTVCNEPTNALGEFKDYIVKEIAGSLQDMDTNGMTEVENITKYTLDEDDIPLSQLSAILKKNYETNEDCEGSFNFEFITEDEAKRNGLYFLNGQDPIHFMVGYFPPPRKVKKHVIPTGNDYLELFQQYPTCLMDESKSTKSNSGLDGYVGVGFNIDNMPEWNVSNELQQRAANSYREIMNSYPTENRKTKRT